MTTDNKLNADIHTLVGLIAGLRVSGGDENLLHLLVEQLKTRQDELNTTSSTKSAKLSPQDLCQWITETEMLIDEMENRHVERYCLPGDRGRSISHRRIQAAAGRSPQQRFATAAQSISR